MLLCTKVVGGRILRFYRISETAKVSIVSFGVVCRFRRDHLLFPAREMDLQLVGDSFGDLTLDRKNVSQFAIKAIGPNVGIIGCFDQLHRHVHGITLLLHASFQDVGDAKLAGDLGQVFRRALITLSRCARDYFQVGDLREARQNLVLDAFGKVGVRFFFAQIFKGQHRDRFALDFSCGCGLFPCFAGGLESDKPKGH